MCNPIPFEPFNQENKEIKEGSKQNRSTKYYLVEGSIHLFLTSNKEHIDPDIDYEEVPFSDYMILCKYIRERK